MKNNGLKEEMQKAFGRKEAFLAINYYNAETLKGVLLAAGSVNRPVILQLSPGTLEYLGLKLAAELGRTALSQYGVKGWIHLDHGDSPERVQQCLDAGFDSVMIDASERPFKENIEITARVVRMAEKYNAHVEAELGYVAKLGQSSERAGFTEPEEARTFADHTGVDALAVAIGTMHGFYREEPRLDLERLARIHSLVPIPLVLHGASGVPPGQLRKAVSEGICKINIATDVKNIFMETVKNSLTLTDEIDLRKIFPPAIDAVKKLVTGKFETIIL
jgi:tagatose 1,6-diphosphate aldolase GatY/KbaY